MPRKGGGFFYLLNSYPQENSKAIVGITWACRPVFRTYSKDLTKCSLRSCPGPLPKPAQIRNFHRHWAYSNEDKSGQLPHAWCATQYADTHSSPTRILKHGEYGQPCTPWIWPSVLGFLASAQTLKDAWLRISKMKVWFIRSRAAVYSLMGHNLSRLKEN